MDRFPALIAHLHDDWGIPLEPIDPAATFERRLLQTKVRSLMLFKLLRWRPIARTVRDLERHSDRINRGP